MRSSCPFGQSARAWPPRCSTPRDVERRTKSVTMWTSLEKEKAPSRGEREANWRIRGDRDAERSQGGSC